MNITCSRRVRLVAVCVTLGWMSVTVASRATAQSLPSNPLRPPRQTAVVEPKPVAPAPPVQPSAVQQASATQRVRASVGAPDSQYAVTPAAHRAPAQPSYRTTAYTPPVTYGSRVQARARGFAPRHATVSQAQATVEEIEPVMDYPEAGDMSFHDLPGEGEVMGEYPGEYMEEGACNDCGTVTADCGSCGTCTTCCGCLIPCPSLTLNNFEFFAGTQGFTGPLNRGETGSFGFHYGGNWAAPVPCMPNQPFGMQIGYRGVSSNYSGASFSEDSRHQNFLTAGLFRRVDWGVQGGVVADVLFDEWYYDKLELTQLRGELSWVFPQYHELGFWFSAGVKTGDVESWTWINSQRQRQIETYEATDLMAFFYRRRFEELGGGHGRVFGGFTGSSEGLLGVDFQLPLTPSLALQSEFTYLVPKDGNNRVAHLQEAWNVGISLVWYPGCRKSIGTDYFRPLFDVADNGSFIVRPLAD